MRALLKCLLVLLLFCVPAFASRTGGTRIIIGENMDRVNDYARTDGAQTIDDWLAASGRTWDEAANADWIRWVTQEGHEVIDIEPDFGRRFDFFRAPSIPGARPPSSVYGTERLELRDYGNYQSVFDRIGRFWGGVSGFDHPSAIRPCLKTKKA
jgi:hypothetical protein